MTVTLTGFDELKKALMELPKSTARSVQERVLLKRAKPIVDAAKAMAPVRTGQLRKSIRAQTKRPRGYKTPAARAFAKTLSVTGSVDAAITAAGVAKNDLSNATLPMARENLKAAPHVPTNTALAAATFAAFPIGVWRDGVFSAGDAPPLFFVTSAASCASADGYLVVQMASGCATAVLPDGALDLREAGAVGDGRSDTGLTATDNSTAFSGISGAVAGQLIYAPGLGPNGGMFASTIADATHFAGAPSISTGGYYASDMAQPVSDDGTDLTVTGTGFTPGAVITMNDGCSVHTQITVEWTGYGGATIAAAGTGGVSGTYLVQAQSPGTGNSNTQALLLVTVASGGLSAITPVSAGNGWPGHYSVTPSSPDSVLPLQPVFSGLTGATVTPQMGVYRARITQPGVCAAVPGGGTPGSPVVVNELSSSDGGTGASFAITYSQTGSYTIGTDVGPAFRRAAARTDASQIRIPTGTYLLGCGNTTFASAISLVGTAISASTILMAPDCQVGFGANAPFYWDAGAMPFVRDLTIDANGAQANTAGAQILDFSGVDKPHIDNVTIKNLGDSHDGENLIAIGITSNGTNLTGYYIDNLNCVFEKTSPEGNHCLNTSLAGGGTITGGHLSHSYGYAGNFTGEDGDRHWSNNTVTAWGYGPGLATSGQVGPFDWLLRNQYNNNTIYSSSYLAGIDGEFPNCIEAPGAYAVLTGNYCKDTAGSFVVYSANVTSIGNKLYDLDRRADGNAHSWIEIETLNAGNISRDGSGFHSIGDTLIDDTGRATEAAYSEPSSPTPTNDTIENISIMGPVAATSGTLDKTTSLKNGISLRQVATVASPLSAFQFLGLDNWSTNLAHWHLSCSSIQPNAADTLQIQVGEGATPTWETASYRYSGNSVSALGVGKFYSQSDSAIFVGPDQFNATGTAKLDADIADLSLTNSNNNKAISFRAAFGNAGNAMEQVSGAGAYTGDNNALTAVRVLFSAQNAIRGECILEGKL